MVQASVIDTSDASRLSAFVQASQAAADADGDDQAAAPAGAVYASKSGSVVDTLEDLLEKAETQLSELRKKEVAAVHNYEMLKQSLKDEISFADQNMKDAKKGIAASAEKRTAAAGDLYATAKELASDVATKETLHRDCMAAAEEYQATSKSRGEELKVLAEAQKVIKEATDGSALNQVSFLELARTSLSSGEDLANLEAVRLVRDLARREHSTTLSQLASR